MISLETEIFNEVASAVRSRYPDTFITGEYVRTPPSFPCVSVEERSNVPYRNTQDSSSLENHVALMYEVNVYSNRRSEHKAECRQLMEVVDNTFMKLGFYRRMLNPIPNLEDATVYRITARYEAIADKNHVIYRR